MIPKKVRNHKRKCSWLSLFTAFVSIKLLWIVNRRILSRAPGGNTGLGPCGPLLTCLPTGQYLTLSHVCISVETPYLLYIVGSLTVNSQATAVMMPERSVFTTRAVHEAHLSLPALGNLDSTSAQC